VIFLVGVVGWVVLEDVRMYEDVVSHDGPGAGGGGHAQHDGHQVAAHPTEEQGH
jgi:hypothetical protein